MSTEETKFNKSLTIIGIVMCVILIPILIVNCTLLIKSVINKEQVPDFGGTMPLIVLTDSMYPEIKSGDLIICKTVDAADVAVGDVISFYDPAGNGTSVVTHEVMAIDVDENGKINFTTKGTNNNAEDRLPVPEEKLIARYTGIRLAGAGNFAIFMQSTAGLIVCVVLPIVLFVGYDVIRRKVYEKNHGDDIESLKAELEALKAEKAKAAEAPAEDAESAPDLEDVPKD